MCVALVNECLIRFFLSVPAALHWEKLNFANFCFLSFQRSSRIRFLLSLVAKFSIESETQWTLVRLNFDFSFVWIQFGFRAVPVHSKRDGWDLDRVLSRRRMPAVHIRHSILTSSHASKNENLRELQQWTLLPLPCLHPNILVAGNLLRKQSGSYWQLVFIFERKKRYINYVRRAHTTQRTAM